MALRTLTHWHIIAYIAKQPIVEYTTKKNTPYCKFNVCTVDNWIDPNSNELRENPMFYNVLMWGHQAEVYSKLLKVGSRVYFSGTIRSTMNPEDQTFTGKYIQLVAQDAVLLAVKKESINGRGNN